MRRVDEHGYQILFIIGSTLGAITILFLSYALVQDMALELALIVPIAVSSILILVLGGIFYPQEIRTNTTRQVLHAAYHLSEVLQDGLNYNNANAVCKILLKYADADAVAITNTDTVLGYEGYMASEYPLGTPIHTSATKEVLQTGITTLFRQISTTGASGTHIIPAGIVGPLKVRDEVIGVVKFYYHNARKANRTQFALVKGLSNLLSIQLSAGELERQAELTAKAEVKALQAQINPHFLFNTLNTMAALTRTDPMRARTLLREFATFYRQTLENSEALISIEKELEQTRRYLGFEHARFGEDRIIEHEYVEPGCEQIQVPAFIIQPIVENAVRHGMRDDGPLHIDIHIATEGDDILISVTDDGLGMNEEAAARLAGEPIGPDATSEKGTGIAMRNVQERIEHIFGADSGIEIMSRPNEGTSISIRLANAQASKL
ncbi:sensor histidine kinase [Atopobium fossor]|uniref:sensor histidine kinase n=1 Tax=Atopobium fossor TaxID=39487 RepID=UPI0004074EE0|nr:histidine kinase [Atopobium fossor]